MTKNKNNIDLLVELVKTSFKMRYQNSILGVLWVLIKPYTIFVVQYFVWTRITNIQIDFYPLYLLLGIIIYTYFNELTILGQLSLLDRANIILKVNFPRQIAVLSALISSLINLGINIILFIIIALISGLDINILGVLYFIFIVLILFIFSLGLSLFTSILTIRLRDLKNIFELGLFLMYWATPIVYVLDSSIVQGRTTDIIAANPLGIVINQIRAGFGIYGEVNFELMLGYLAISVVILILGWHYFSRNVRKIAEYI
jgi:ABC-type polysaccharide/polyol phosphate export permease